ncbi:MAG: relaxase/mobilization nuclease domain-containing protein [Desulfuromonadaceae bacterium]
MIIKGRSRGGAAALAAHLLSPKNERVEVVELRGVLAHDLIDALREVEDVASGSNCRLFLYHANISPCSQYTLTRAQWLEAVNTLETRLGFTDQPRAIVIHVHEGREHCHIVWSRIDPESLKGLSDSHNFRKHEEVARDLERRFGHERVQGVHAEREGKPRPARTPSRADLRQQERAGKSGREAVAAVRQVRAELTALWHQTGSGRAFAAALAARGYVLARGDTRDFVVLDSVGAVHSLARRIEGVRAAAVRERMADVDRDGLPSVAEAKALLVRRIPRAEAGQMEPLSKAAGAAQGAEKLTKAGSSAPLWRAVARAATASVRDYGGRAGEP